jgi:hypothetical protein
MLQKELVARLDTLEVLAETYNLMDVRAKIEKMRKYDDMTVMQELPVLEADIRERIKKWQRNSS